MKLMKSARAFEFMLTCSVEGVTQKVSSNLYWYDIDCGHGCLDYATNLN